MCYFDFSGAEIHSMWVTKYFKKKKHFIFYESLSNVPTNNFLSKTLICRNIVKSKEKMHES